MLNRILFTFTLKCPYVWVQVIELSSLRENRFFFLFDFKIQMFQRFFLISCIVQFTCICDSSALWCFSAIISRKIINKINFNTWLVDNRKHCDIWYDSSVNSSCSSPVTSRLASRRPSSGISIPWPKIFWTITSVCRATAQRNSSRKWSF